MKEGEGPFLEHARKVPALRRRRGGDGLRRGGPGRHRRAQGRDLRARLRAARPKRSASRREDIIFDPNIFAVATGIEEHNDYARRLHRGGAPDQAELPHVHVSGGVSNCRSPSAATSRCARRSTRSSSTTPSPPAWTWASSTPASWRSMTTSTRAARARRGRDPQSPRGRDRAPARSSPSAYKGGGSAEEGDRPHLARGHGRGAAHPRAGPRHHRLHRADTEEARLEGGAAAARHRRPADGRHERRRRPLRRRQDVPAAGGEERPA